MNWVVHWITYSIDLINWTFETIRKFSKDISDLDRYKWLIVINLFLLKFYRMFIYIYISVKHLSKIKIKDWNERKSWRKTIYRIRRRKWIIYERNFCYRNFYNTLKFSSKTFFHETPCICWAQIKKKKKIQRIISNVFFESFG